MSAIIDHRYLDFFNIAVDAYNEENNSIYRKLMMTIIANFDTPPHKWGGFFIHSLNSYFK